MKLFKVKRLDKDYYVAAANYAEAEKTFQKNMPLIIIDRIEQIYATIFISNKTEEN